MLYKAIFVAAAALLSSSAVTVNADELRRAEFSGGQAPIVPVRYYGPGYYYYDGGLLDIPGEAIAGAEGIVGGVLAGPRYGYGYGYGYELGGAAACAREYRSFDPATGTYTTYSGEQVLCPYLRG
jgi:BA14K-like protein